MTFVRTAIALAIVASATSAAPPDFNASVAPILIRRCLECHSSAEPAGKLDLSRRDTARTGGKGGAAVVPGKAADSLLLHRVADGEMPPEKAGKSQALPKTEIDILREWIAAGAAWPDGRTLDAYEATTDVRGGRDWWAFQPVKRPAVPGSAPNPIDAFVRRDLDARRREPAPEADRRTLIRRLSFDLVGLPPTAEEVEAFVADTSDDAYERLVDRLLASPHFGERWAGTGSTPATRRRPATSATRR
ncbi:MAG: DUF1549 domain-containing protein [Gemmataceae bacterium]